MAEVYSTTPLSPIRKIIAARMVEAKCTIPHFSLVADLEVSALRRLHQNLCAENPGARISINDLLIKACASALMDTPELNVQWSDEGIRQFRSADISIVVALNAGGLSTPIIRDAESKTIWDISAEVKELIARANRNALRTQEIVGGSFSMSNLGMYGVRQFDAIINPPQCGILAIGAAKPQVVVSDEGGTSIATVIRVTLSVDHRAVDGVRAAMFLSALRERIERPEYIRGSGNSDG